MPFDLTAGIVRILLGPNKGTAGTGFVVNNQGLVVTCAHVVEDAHAGPGDTVSLIFYAAKERGEQKATVLQDYWKASNAEDVALLQLEKELPEKVKPLPLGRCLDKHHFSTFGFPNVAPIGGRWGEGRVLGPLEMKGFQRLQLRSEEITKGVSGAPVWDDDLEAVIGIVIGIGQGRSIEWGRAEIIIPLDPYGQFRHAAFATPTETLWQICADLRPADQCPYRNLEAFTKNDDRFFFGRERVLDELVESLQHEPQFLAVLGPSGCGKSSLVQAGLLPRLEKEADFGSNRWEIIVTRPTDSAFTIIATSLQEKQQHIGLIIDQFEELFTAYPEAKCQEMVTLLIEFLERSPHIHLILTLRNDFYSYFVQFEALEQWRKRGMVNVSPILRPNEIRDIIQKPAEVARLRFDEGLVDIIVNDTLAIHSSPGNRGPGAPNTVLPLLEFALTQLWERRDKDQGKLSLATYRTLGGVTGGLKQWADEVYTALAERERELAHRIFTQLVYVNDETQQIPYSCRRRLKDELIRTITSEQGMVEQVVQQLIIARLLVTNQIGESATIELSHETLISEWPRLRDDWLPESRKDILFQQSLSKDVTEWEQRKPSRDLLYRGDKLKKAKEWAKRNTPSKQEAAFIRASATRQTLSLMSLIVVALLLISSAGVAVRVALTRPADPTLVTTPQDSVSGSLRYCIDNAPSGSTIRFASGLGGTIKLTGGGLAFAGGKQLTIAGPGEDKLTISGGNTDAIIHVSKGATINISGLSFKNSETVHDAFLFNEGTLTLNHSTVSANKTTAGGTIFIGSVSSGGNSLGGGIENRGSLTVINSIISNNSSIGIPGDGLGGGIENLGQLTVIHSTFSNNSASSQGGNSFGGGIDNYGKLTVTSSTFSNNSVSSSGGQSLGGGIFNHSHGTLTVTSSTFSHNSANSRGSKGVSQGGGIDNDGKLTVVTSTFSNNSASSADGGNSFGGGILNYSSDTLTVTSSTFAHNSVSSSGSNSSSQGGGIDNYGKLTLVTSTFSHNLASSQNGDDIGGGIANEEGTLMVTSSTFTGNSVSGNQGGSGGGIDNETQLTVTNSTFTNNSASSSGNYGLGGGIYNYSKGTLTVNNSTFSNNKASGNKGGSGGGIENDGSLTVTVSTIVHNSASSNQDAFGGGIDNYGSSSSVIIRFCTIYSNMSKEGGGIWTDPTNRNRMKISSSIIAANSAQNGPDISGSLISGGYNRLQNFAGVTGLNATFDRQVTLSDLKLDPILRNNGGPIQTLALLPGSPAIDAVPREACSITIKDSFGHTITITTDQRGNPRPDGSENACDIGAYESSY